MTLLADALQEKAEVQVENLGGRNLASIVEQWDEVMACTPTLVTALPFSDYAKTPLEEFRSRVQALFRLAEDYAEERGGDFHLFFGDLRVDPVYVAGLAQHHNGPLYSPEVFTRTAQKNDVAARAADSYDAITIVPVVDQNAIHPEWIGPGGHPNDLGHGYLAGCFRTPVEDWLGRALASV